VSVLVVLLVPAATAVAVVLRRSSDRRAGRDATLAVLTLGGDLARSVRSGCTLVEALASAREHHHGIVGGELEVLHARLVRGGDLDHVLGVAARSDCAPFAQLVRACRLGVASAGDLATVVDGAVASISDEIELSDETRSLTTQAWTSVWALAALPLVGAAVFTLVDPRVADVLVSTGPGRVCLVAGVVLDGAGLWGAGRLVRRAVR